jgi:hypothetical protein
MNIKNIFLVDETLPQETIKKKYKARVYYFLGLSWLVSFILIFLIPEDIMQYSWAQSFVNFMSYVAPVVGGLEDIRINGVEDEYLARRLRESGLVVLPHISFYYAGMWLYSLLSIPYMILLAKKNFAYNKDSNFLHFISIKNIIHNFYHRPIVHYFVTTVLMPFMLVFVWFTVAGTVKWFQMLYIYPIISVNLSYVFTTGIILSSIFYIYIHIQLKKQEKLGVK